MTKTWLGLRPANWQQISGRCATSFKSVGDYQTHDPLYYPDGCDDSNFPIIVPEQVCHSRTQADKTQS